MLKRFLILLLFASLHANINLWNGDNITSLGLNGTHNSVGYRVAEIEKHIHSPEYWYGKDIVDDLASKNSLTAWTFTTGAANTYGEFVQLADGTELVGDFPNCKYVDIHRVFITALNQADSTYIVEIWAGTDTTTNATLITEFPIRASNVALGTAIPLEIQMPRGLATNKFWAKAKCEGSGKTISMLFGVHCYEN